jgi:DNA-binding response OmpR family regulator
MSSGHTVLIIDDEPLVLESLAAFLEDSGYRVDTAPDGTAGIEAFMKKRSDVVLTDMRMPRLDGLGGVTALHALSPETPVIALSGMGDSADAALRAGAAASLVKPVLNLDEVVQTIERVLRRS